MGYTSITTITSKETHINFPNAIFSWIRHHPHYKKEGTKVYWVKQGYANSCISYDSITRVHGDGRVMEHSQTRSTCPKILTIFYRFEEQDIEVF